jgi:nicotinamide-nucleotide amidase
MSVTPSDLELTALAERVAARLAGQGRHLVTAESCTGGWIAKVCTDLPGSSRWFLGGAVAYGNSAKTGWLGVGAGILLQEGAVSEAAVRAMALGALERLGGEVSVAVSGTAGPDGGTPDKPVGTIWLAWARRRDIGTEVSVAKESFAGDREAIRRQTVQRALQGLLEP